MNELVVGFLVADEGRGPAAVVLVRKARSKCDPSFVGLLNGPGGEVNPGESVYAAVAREVREETGLETETAGWQARVRIVTPGPVVHVFVYIADRTRPIPVLPPGPAVEEPAEWYSIKALGDMKNVVPDVPWLLGLCLDKRVQGPVVVRLRQGEPTGRRTGDLDTVPRRL